MPVDQNNYSDRGGHNLGIVFRCIDHVANRLVYFCKNAQNGGGWVIRDFVAGLRLDNNHSNLTVDQIEQAADQDEFPPWRNVEDHPDEWEVYLRLRTTAAFRVDNVDELPPSAEAGEWLQL